MEDKQKVQKRKKNMKLFPICKSLGWDYLFFYTVNFLFLTQVKHISPADVVLIDSFYALFGILMQVPATFIIEYLGRKKSIVFANVLNCLYMIVVITSKNLFNLIIAEILSSLAFAIKETSEPALLNSSIPPSRYKSKIFAKINEKGMSNYYVLEAVSTVLAGFMYDINPYIPILLALATTILVTVLSMGFEEDETKIKRRKISEFNQIEDIKDSFKFILKSERLKSLILFAAISVGIFSVLTTYEVSMLEELNMQAKYLCIIKAVLSIIAGLAIKKQEKFHNRYKNKSLSLLMYITGLEILLAGIFGIISSQYIVCIVFVVILYGIRYSCKGIFYPLIERYLRNFANSQIDTKIFTVKNFLGSILSAVTGLFAAFLLDRMNTAYCMIIIGFVTLIIVYIMNKYMKSRVGLKPSEYPKEDIKYDELKEKSSIV